MDKVWLSLEDAAKIIERHDEQRELPPSLVAAASEVAERQGGWLSVGQGSVLLSRLTGESYDTNSTPIYKAIERKLVETVPAPLSDEVRLDANSFLSYLRAFKVRR